MNRLFLVEYKYEDENGHVFDTCHEFWNCEHEAEIKFSFGYGRGSTLSAVEEITTYEQYAEASGKVMFPHFATRVYGDKVPIYSLIDRLLERWREQEVNSEAAAAQVSLELS